MTLARTQRTQRTPSPSLAEAWWPLVDVGTSDSRWFAEHIAAGWWDPGDPHRSRLRHAAALADELLASLPQEAIAEDAVMLELGCGPGSGLQELARRWPGELQGWDGSALARGCARAMAPAALVHDAGALPLAIAPGSIDVVWVPRGFARGLDLVELLAEAHRVLRPGGLLAAVLSGPGVWAWEERRGPWDEQRTGMLLTGLARPDEQGGPICFTSGWWLAEHAGRGFETVVVRRAGVAMLRPDQGHGLGVWRRGSGPAISAAGFGAVRHRDLREGRASHRQLACARAEALASASRERVALAGVQRRAALLARPDAVDGHPRVRDALAHVAALEAEVRRLRELAAGDPAAPLRALGSRLREVAGGDAATPLRALGGRLREVAGGDPRAPVRALGGRLREVAGGDAAAPLRALRGRLRKTTGGAP
jgi:SAM-dependent methyltransferase